MFLDVGGHRTSVVRMGTHGPWILAHGGWIGPWELWQQPFELLQAEWRCLGFDHRGAGANASPPEEISAAALVADLVELLDRHEIEQCVLAGESLGALTCVQAALDDPGRFRGLVLVDGLTTPGPHLRDMAYACRSDFTAAVASFVDACVPEPDSDHLRAWGRQMLMRSSPEAAARVLECHLEVETIARTADLAVPTLLVHGELDAIVPLDEARATAARIPGSRLVVVPGAGHVPTVTRPHAVVSAVMEWAAGLSA